MKTMELLGPHAGSSSELETFSCLFCTKNIKHVNILSAELLVYIKPRLSKFDLKSAAFRVS